MIAAAIVLFIIWIGSAISVFHYAGVNRTAFRWSAVAFILSLGGLVAMIEWSA